MVPELKPRVPSVGFIDEFRGSKEPRGSWEFDGPSGTALIRRLQSVALEHLVSVIGRESEGSNERCKRGRRLDGRRTCTASR